MLELETGFIGYLGRDLKNQIKGARVRARYDYLRTQGFTIDEAWSVARVLERLSRGHNGQEV